MTILGNILTGLKTPDDQGRDWYGWASNQISHAFLGTLAAYAAYPGDSVLVAFICGALKEATDLVRNPVDRAAVLDSITDVAFWCFGAWIAATQGDIVAVIIMAFALLCGVIPRVRSVVRGA